MLSLLHNYFIDIRMRINLPHARTKVGCLENLGSDRRIINTASLRLDVLFFINYNLEEALPWHSSLSRTRQLYGEDPFKELFKKVLKACIDKGCNSSFPKNIF
jgi:Transposase domain (DUF772)